MVALPHPRDKTKPFPVTLKRQVAQEDIFYQQSRTNFQFCLSLIFFFFFSMYLNHRVQVPTLKNATPEEPIRRNPQVRPGSTSASIPCCPGRNPMVLPTHSSHLVGVKTHRARHRCRCFRECR